MAPRILTPNFIAGLSWSKSVELGRSSSSFLSTQLHDVSLLAVGSRAGRVTFFRYDKRSSQCDIVQSIVVSDRSVTHLAWTGWSGDSESARATLAASCTDGRVAIIAISCQLQSSGSPRFEFEYDEAMDPEFIDRRGITALYWAERDGEKAGKDNVIIFTSCGDEHPQFY